MENGQYENIHIDKQLEIILDVMKFEISHHWI